MGENKFTRKELYDLVWAETLSSIIKKYDITYGEIRKICNGMNIPLPVNGHWTRIRLGKPVVIEKLPEDYSGKDEVTLSLKKESTDIESSSKESGDKTIVQNSNSEFKVPDRLTKPDDLIIKTKDYYDAIKRFDWRTGGSYPSHDGVLKINVSQECLPRALRIMDTIIKILKSRNHDVITKYDKTYAIIYGEEIEIRLKEKNVISDIKSEYGSRQLVTTGKLGFIIEDYPKKEVNDGLDLLETKIATIIAKLEAEGKREMEERIEREKRQKIREEQLRIEREILERKENELKRFKDLFIQAELLHKANILREYVKSVESNAIRSGNFSDELKEWINWATNKIAWFDPLIKQEDQLLDDDYKTKLYRDLNSR